MAATRAQIGACLTHKQVCQLQGVPQSILRNRATPGSMNPPSPSGNVVWSSVGPTDPNAPSQSPQAQPGDLLVWAAFQPRITYREDILQAGADAIPRGQAQCPTIDDPITQNPITVRHQDWLIDQAGTIYEILNPVQTPGGEFWYFEIRAMR